MTTLTEERPTAATATEHFDVLIAGAGISGIGSAWHMQHQAPGQSFVVLDAQESFGGTWITHKYPGIRSDSDLYTFGYRFKPWIDEPIASAAKILNYMQEVIEENHLGRHIRYGHRIEKASWSDADRRWTVSGTANGKPFTVTATFLWMCQGYYRHEEGYTPDWPGMADYKGRNHPPANLAGRRQSGRQAGDRDRFGGDGGDAGSGDRREMRTCHAVAAIADLFLACAERE